METILEKAQAANACEEALAACAGLTFEAVLALPKAPRWAVWYAENVLKGRFRAAEGVIAQSPRWAHYYARNVLQGRFRAAEEVIAQSPRWAHYYATGALKGRLICHFCSIKEEEQKHEVA